MRYSLFRRKQSSFALKGIALRQKAHRKRLSTRRQVERGAE
jgi:hypothetical protein